MLLTGAPVRVFVALDETVTGLSVTGALRSPDGVVETAAGSVVSGGVQVTFDDPQEGASRYQIRVGSSTVAAGWMTVYPALVPDVEGEEEAILETSGIYSPTKPWPGIFGGVEVFSGEPISLAWTPGATLAGAEIAAGGEGTLADGFVSIAGDTATATWVASAAVAGVWRLQMRAELASLDVIAAAQSLTIVPSILPALSDELFQLTISGNPIATGGLIWAVGAAA